MIEVHFERLVAGTRDEVFARYCDHASWTEWAGLGKVRLERRGHEHRDGVGAIRIISNPGLSVREEVVAFEPPARMAYRLLSRAVPIRDHRGEVRFEDRGEQTNVVWQCSFRPILPGTGGLMRRVVERTFTRALDGLERDRQRA